jgi:hypothetical protein
MREKRKMTPRELASVVVVVPLVLEGLSRLGFLRPPARVVVLEDARSRWELFSDEEIADLASLVAAADESYDLSADSERLSAEIKAERDHREMRLP